MASELVGSVSNVAALDGYPKWPKSAFTWSTYSALPAAYSGKRASYNDKASGAQPLYSAVFSSSGLNTFGLSAAASAFTALQSFTGATFTKSKTGTSDIHFGAFTSSYNPITSKGDTVGAYSAPGYQTIASGNNYVHAGDVWIANASGGDVGTASASNPSFATLTLKHELGHILGLVDTIQANGNVQSGYDATQNNQHFTLMSYNTPLANGHSLSEYQLYDIAALQSLYGQNVAYNSGDTTYTLNSFIGSQQPTDGDNNRYYSIWDASGNDTIDLTSVSSSSDAALVDLRPGHFSSIGHNAGVQTYHLSVTNPGIQNVSIAYGTTIENVIGSPYNDVIVGSELANNISGGAGDDIIYGSGAAVRMAASLGFSVGGLASDDGDYGYFSNGYHSHNLVADAPHTIDGGDGNDYIFGSSGGDTLNGGYGNDWIYGGSGNDVIDSGQNQNITGVMDQDSLFGGAGNDVITARTKDTVDAGDGNDVLHVIGGSVSGTLGAGDDSADFSNGVGLSILHGGDGNDKFTVADNTPVSLYGDAGSDYFVMTGTSGASIDGGAGNDLYDVSQHQTGDNGTIALQFDANWGNDTLRTASNDGYAQTSGGDKLAHWHVDSLQFTDGTNYIPLTVVWNPTVYQSMSDGSGGTINYAYGDLAITDASGDSLFMGAANGSWGDGDGATFSNSVKLDIPDINGIRAQAGAATFTITKGDPSGYNSYSGTSVPTPWGVSSQAANKAQISPHSYDPSNDISVSDTAYGFHHVTFDHGLHIA